MIHAGVEIPSDADLTPVLSPGRVPVVGTAGPLEALKGLPFFLGAAQRVLAENPQVQFLIAGAGPEEQNLRRLARELKIVEAVTFVPKLYDFSTALEAIDIFCLPSLRQGLGTIMLEAMGRGIPVIASGVGGVFSVVSDNETGLVVPPSNSARLAERILELLSDPLRARTLGSNGRRSGQAGFQRGTHGQRNRRPLSRNRGRSENPTPSKCQDPKRSQGVTSPLKKMILIAVAGNLLAVLSAAVIFREPPGSATRPMDIPLYIIATAFCTAVLGLSLTVRSWQAGHPLGTVIVGIFCLTPFVVGVIAFRVFAGAFGYILLP